MPASTSPQRYSGVIMVLLSLLGCTTINNINANSQRMTDQQMQAAVVPGMRAGQVSAAPPPTRPSAAQAARPSPADLGVPLAELHRTYTGSILLAGRQAPLPDGQWYLAARGVARGRGTDINEELLLLRQSGSSVSGFLIYSANPLAKPAPGYPLFPSCSDSNRLYADVREATPGGAQDCLSIQFVSEATLRASNASVFVKALVDAANARNLTIPETMLVTSLTQASQTHGMVFTLYLNPDLAGVPPEPSTVRAESGWASFNLDKDPARVAYLDKLKTWSEGWHGVMKVAFDGHGVQVPAGAGVTP
jgi:hypothetical protein